MQDDLKEIARLFQEAFRMLSMAKCRVTAKAYFNMAQTKLDDLETHPDPAVRKAIKDARAGVRTQVGGDRSLHRIMEIYAAYWTQNL